MSWSSKKQVVVAHSSIKFEYRALSHAACDVLWLCSLLFELRISLPFTPILWCDNINAAALAYNPVFHARTKHIELHAHFIRDQVLAHRIEIRHVPSHDQLVDCLTKPLPLGHHQFLCDKLTLRFAPTSHLRGAVKS